MQRTIAHVDMDAFFASVAQLDDPSLAGKAVLVGGHSTVRGVVCSASYPARACGVKSGMPLFQAMKLCPQAIVVPVRLERYREISRRLREIWQRAAPVVEPVGFEEGYLDLTGCDRLYGPIGPVMERLRATVFRETGLTCSVGVGTSRLVAKMASRAGKPDGLVVVPPGSEAEWLSPQRVGVVPGVGPKTAVQLERLGIKTIGDLLALSDEEVVRRCGQFGVYLREIAHGKDIRPVSDGREAKSIGAQTTLDADLRDVDRLRRVMHTLVQEVAFRLRRAGSRASTATVTIRYARTFETITRAHTYSVPTDDEDAFLRTACDLLAQHRDGAQAVRLLGFTVSGLSTGRQLGLFDAAPDRARVWSAVDQMRRKYGFAAVQRATALAER
ncbi:MAG: DNA polymerase IV [Candidatus Sericytochromatia bacterium]|nr:DNA polymerase IV [Candidatus Tanganyikabacteria bacterium]